MFFKSLISNPVINLLEVMQPLLSQIAPNICVLCLINQASDGHFCDACQKDLPILSHSCRQCAQFLPPSAKDILASGSLRCGTCLKDPPPFDQGFALFSYDPPIVQLIIRLKFQGRLLYAEALGKHLFKTASLNKSLRLPDVLLPIPLHPLRLRTRGFNQAVEITRPFAKKLKIPMDLEGIKRRKATLPQSSLTAIERQKNLLQAFSSDRDYSGIHVGLVDDVMTTGETMAACARLLKQQGASYVSVWCAARRS